MYAPHYCIYNSLRMIVFVSLQNEIRDPKNSDFEMSTPGAISRKYGNSNFTMRNQQANNKTSVCKLIIQLIIMIAHSAHYFFLTFEVISQ